MNCPPPDPNNDSIDAFHRGQFFVVQPKHNGHRAGMDAMILAGAVPTSFRGYVADLGSGAGAAGLAVASRCQGAHVTLVERCDTMVDYAHKTLHLQPNHHLRPRLSLIHADVSLTGKQRIASGLRDQSFDFAIMNPPFNQANDRTTPNKLRAQAHVMPAQMFEHWLKTASAILKPGGQIAIIARPQSLSDIMEAAKGRFGGLQIFPILPRPHSDAIRIIIVGIRGSRAALRIKPSLSIHSQEGDHFSPHANAINNGQGTLLDWS